MQSIFVIGPTASGKTTLGIQLAKRFGGAVISADSRMVYQGLDIGTGKPTWEHRQLEESPWITPRVSQFGPIYAIDGVDHYGLDLVTPETPFTLTDYLAFARPLIQQLQHDGIQPVVVGGTGLYIRGLADGLVPPPTDPVLRTELETWSIEALRDALASVDPKTVQKESANRRRLIRALEVYRLTGRPMSEPHTTTPIHGVILVPAIERSDLIERIDQRLKERFDAGLIEEVRSLLAANISPEWLCGLGLEYRYVTEWLQIGLNDKRQLFDSLAAAIHQYAKRQQTYLRHQLSVTEVSSADEAVSILKSIDNQR